MCLTLASGFHLDSISALVFHGAKLRREVLPVCVHSHQTVAHLKVKAKSMLDGRPDDVQLLIDGDEVADSCLLSECRVQQNATNMHLVISYAPESSSFFAEPDPGSDLSRESSPMILGCSTPSDLGLDLSRQSSPITLGSLRGEQQPVELPQTKCWQERPSFLTSRSPENLCTQAEEQAVLEGKLFRVHVHVKVFLGARGHVRSCTLPVDASTKISQVEQRLLAWMADEPSELLLQSQGCMLQGTSALWELGLSAGSVLEAIASYENVR